MTCRCVHLIAPLLVVASLVGCLAPSQGSKPEATDSATDTTSAPDLEPAPAACDLAQCDGRCRVPWDAGDTGICDLGTCECMSVAAPDCADGFCRIPASRFLAGYHSRPTFRLPTPDSRIDLPQHWVVLRRPFVLQQAEVTEAQWRDLMGEGHTSPFACGDTCPIAAVTLFDALTFANRKSESVGLELCYELVGCRFADSEVDPGTTGRLGRVCESATFVGPDCAGFRLPSEWELEVAIGLGLEKCVVGMRWDPSYGNDADFSCEAWTDIPLDIRYCRNAAVDYTGCIDVGLRGPTCGGPSTVDEYPPNRLGFLGLQGNAGELSGSLFDPVTHQSLLDRLAPGGIVPEADARATLVDPGFDRTLATAFLSRRPDPAPEVIVRGGNFRSTVHNICSNSRFAAPFGGSDARQHSGFRLARTVGMAVPIPQ